MLAFAKLKRAVVGLCISAVYKLYGNGQVVGADIEGALIDSLVSHQYVQVITVVVLFCHPQ